MRTTQYIGLTKAAQDFLADYCQPIETTNSTSGMFGEDIPLGEWVVIKDWEAVKMRNSKSFIGLKVTEEEQCTPWSSGPMIFTNLDIHYENGTVGEDFFSWIDDPTVLGEFDSATGRMYV